MLQNIRDNTSGPLAWGVVGLIIVTFAFFGIESFRGAGGQQEAAKVGDQEISAAELQANYNQRYRQMQQLLGDRFRPEMIDESQLRSSVLNGMIQNALLDQYTSDQGFGAAPEQVLEFIKTVPEFQVDGKFSVDAYRSSLARQGRSPASFEARVAALLTSEQLRTGISDSAIVTKQDVDVAWKLEKQKRDISWMVFSAEKFKQEDAISDDKVKEYYERNTAEFVTPERLQLSYVELNRGSISVSDEPTNEVLKTLYDAEVARFTTPEERKARHILIRVNDETDSETAKEVIIALKQRIDAGEKFGDIATEASEDPVSAKEAGDLGWVRKGVMVPAFETALFSLAAGAMSEPVETDFGWHLILLEELREANVKKADEEDVRQELVQLYQQREAAKRFDDYAERLDDLAYDHPESLDPIAKALSLDVSETAWFTRDGGAGITAFDEVLEAAFSNAVKEDGENSAAITLPGDRRVVIRKLAHEAASTEAFEQVSASIREKLVNQAALDAADAAADTALNQLKAGDSAEKVATEANVELQAKSIAREQADTPAAIRNLAFTMPRPATNEAESATVVEKGRLNGNDSVVIVLASVTDGNTADASESDRESLKRRLRDRRAGLEFTAVRESLSDAYSVEIFEQAAPAQP